MIDKSMAPEAVNTDPRSGEPMSVRVDFGGRRLTRREAETLREGMVAILERSWDDDVEVYIGGRIRVRGQAVVVDGKICVRVDEIVGRTGGANAPASALSEAE